MEQLTVLVMGIHFLTNFLLLTAAGKLSGRSGGKKGIFYAAILGGMYAGACLMPGLEHWGGGFWRLVCIGIMSCMAYGKSAPMPGILYFMLTMALEGLAMGSGWSLVLLASGLCYLYLGGFWGGNRTGGDRVAVVIGHGEKKLALTALHDTGNRLRDPLTGYPVLVVQADVAQKLVGLDTQQLREPLKTILSAKVPGLRLMPYHAIGTPNGMLLAIRPEWVEMDGKRTEVLVAFAPQRLDQLDRFQALAGGAL